MISGRTVDGVVQSTRESQYYALVAYNTLYSIVVLSIFAIIYYNGRDILEFIFVFVDEFRAIAFD